MLASFSLALVIKLLVRFGVLAKDQSGIAEQTLLWGFGFFASIVLFDLWHRLLREDVPRTYRSMTSAQDAILSEIGRVSRHARSVPLHVRLIGCRYSNVGPVLNNFVTRIQNDTLKVGPLAFSLYYADEDYLRSQLPDGRSRASVEGLNARMADMPETLKTASDKIVDVKVFPYRSPPFLFAYIIGESTIFYGAFVPDPKHPSGKYYIGPPNTCFVARRGQPFFFDLFRWLSGLCYDYELKYEQRSKRPSSQPDRADTDPPLHSG